MKKKILAFLICIAMIAGLVPFSAFASDMPLYEGSIYDTSSPYLTKVGSWNSSSLTGYNGTNSIYCSGEGSATWEPDLIYSGTYRVYIWNMVNSSNVSTVTVEITDKNGTVTQKTYNHKTGTEGFVDLGEYEFDYGVGAKVKVLSPSSGGFVRLNSVKFEIVSITGTQPDIVPPTGSETYPDYETRSIPQKTVSIPETSPDAVKIYVSPNGNGDGTESNPYSLTQAQAQVRSLIASGYPENGIGVYLKGGTYTLTDSLTFTSADSGTADAPVIWQAYNNEAVSLTTSRQIDHDDISLVTDETVLSKIPASARSNVYVTDLSDSGFGDVPEMNLRDSVPYTLTFGDQSGHIARWPNDGFGRTGTLIDSSSRNDSGPRKKGFTYKIIDTRPLRWGDASDIWLNGYWMTPYTIDYARLADLDLDNMRMSGKEYNGLGSYGNARYYVENLIEELDAEGEWFLDTETNLLYFYPFEGWQQQTISFSTSNAGIVEFTNASNVILRGMKLEVAGGNGATFGTASSNCGIIGCDIINVSGVGASINGTYNYVRDCNISYTGKPGISVNGGNPYKLISGNNYAENNEIHNTGTGGGSKQGITISGSGNRISHNHIYDIPTHGISGGGMEQIIEYNIVERTNLEMGDTGGIYFLNYGMGYGTKIRYNIVKDSVGLMAQTMTGEGALGIYLDDVTSGVEVTGNLVYNAQEPGLFGHGGRYLTFDNNILVNCEEPIKVVKTAIANSLADGGAVKSNLANYDYNNEPFTSRYPMVAETLTDEFGEPKYNQVTNNVTYNSGAFSYSTGVANSGVDQNNLQFEGQPPCNTTDFTDFDYTAIKALNPDFEELPFDEMGTYTGGARTNTTSIVYNNNADAFNLTYPQNGQTNVDPNTQLKWDQGKGGIKSYTVYIAEDSSFNNLVSIIDTEPGDFNVELDYGKTYYWRVKATPMLGYTPRWNANGVYSFTTMNIEDKLQGEILSAQSVLNNTAEGTLGGQFPLGSKLNLSNAIAQAQTALSGTDAQAKKNAMTALSSEKSAYLAKVNSEKKDLSTHVYDNHNLDTIGEKPLGLFLRSYSPLDVTTQYDPLDSTNKVVRFNDQHANYHYGQRFFESQDGYIEAGASVLPAQANGAFSVTLMQTDTYAVESGVSTGAAAKVVFATDGYIYGDLAKQHKLMSYTANTWYDIKIALDLKKGSYDVYVNGDLKAENIPQTNANVKQVNQILFDTSDGTTATHATTGIFYTDNTLVRIPESKGSNGYLMSLKVNGQPISNFDPSLYYYQVDLTEQQLKNATIDYESGSNAIVNIWNADSEKYITVISPDLKITTTYILKSTPQAQVSPEE